MCLAVRGGFASPPDPSRSHDHEKNTPLTIICLRNQPGCSIRVGSGSLSQRLRRNRNRVFERFFLASWYHRRWVRGRHHTERNRCGNSKKRPEASSGYTRQTQGRLRVANGHGRQATDRAVGQGLRVHGPPILGIIPVRGRKEPGDSEAVRRPKDQLYGKNEKNIRILCRSSAVPGTARAS